MLRTITGVVLDKRRRVWYNSVMAVYGLAIRGEYMSEFNEQAPQQNDAPVQAENRAPVDSTEISALARHREAMKARVSPPRQEQQEADGQPQPNVGQQAPEQPQREPYIPRERFDEVLRQRDTLQQQITQFQQQLQQPRPAQVGPTGMMQPPQQPAISPQQAQQVQSFLEQVTKDPTARQEWQKKIANGGIPALAEFVVKAMEDRGRPLLEEYTQSINDRLLPLQRSLVQQQLSSYASQRATDPEFQVARPVFDQLVNTASQRGYDVTNPQVLSTIEFLAKQQARQFQPAPQQPQMPQVMPFSERPGNAGQGLPRPQTRQLNPQERAMAERFGMSPDQYVNSLRAMGVEK